MALSAARWKTITESRFDWERNALEFLRERLPDIEPYRAWSNFDFIAEDGSINEVDVLVLAPRGLFLVEIKSTPGTLEGDAHTWTWTTPEGRRYSDDNPRRLVSLKAKRLKALLIHQKVSARAAIPYVEEVVWCSSNGLKMRLSETASWNVFLSEPGAPGVIAYLTKQPDPGLGARDRRVDSETARAVEQALHAAGIRQSSRARKVGQYQLQELLSDGPTYQDWMAPHPTFEKVRRRIHLFPYKPGLSKKDREHLQRAAEREFELLRNINHPGILSPIDYIESELGPALIFDHDTDAIRLDHYLERYRTKLSVDTRMHLMRQIADAVRYAHSKKIVHRALSPQSILVYNPGSATPGIKIFDWQTGYRMSGSGGQFEVVPTSNVEEMVEDLATAYMAPEVFTNPDAAGEPADIFSLGAIAYHLFSGERPAENQLALHEKLRESDGLRISTVMDGAGESLQQLIAFSTFPNLAARMDSMDDFVEILDSVENDLTRPESEERDPNEARPDDVLPGGYKVIKRLGGGASSNALLIDRDGQESVMKIARTPEDSETLRQEAEVLRKLRDQHFPELRGTQWFGGRLAILMSNAGEKTLAQWLRDQGKLHVDMLERLGEDLLQAIEYLDNEGIQHRDIKPANIGISRDRDRLRLVLFDFSLSAAPFENIRAGTRPYLEPFLAQRKPPRWDQQAERFAGAMTLYEMATGTLPKWGDGQSDADLLDCEATLGTELFEPNLREHLTDFFTRALRRDPNKRFDTAEEMLRAWRAVFADIDKTTSTSEGDEADQALLDSALAEATRESPLSALPLSLRAQSVLQRLNLVKVGDLLKLQVFRLYRLPGVGNRTRREIGTVWEALYERLGPRGVETASEQAAESSGAVVRSVDLLAKDITPAYGGNDDKIVGELLGIAHPKASEVDWPSQNEIASRLGIKRPEVVEILRRLRAKWDRTQSLTVLRQEIRDILERSGGVMNAAVLTRTVLALRGSMRLEPLRSAAASAVTRAAVETERIKAKPAFILSRQNGTVLVAIAQEFADWAARLGNEADGLAKADPIAAPIRVVETLQHVKPPSGGVADTTLAQLTPAQLVALAASASRTAAVSTLGEVYPRGMDSLRTLKLAQGAIMGADRLSDDELIKRVAGRYPDGEKLPARPALDDLLREAGLDFEWNPVEAGGRGAYVNKLRQSLQTSTDSSSLMRYRTGSGVSATTKPQAESALQFEERLERAQRQGAFLALSVHPRNLVKAEQEIASRFRVRRVSIDQVLIREMKAAALALKVEWPTALHADSTSHDSRDWRNLNTLVSRAMETVKRTVEEAGRDATVLITNAGLLARYDQIGFFDWLRERVAARDGIRGAWALIPSVPITNLPVLDHRQIPVFTPAQWARIPEEWIQNLHRTEPGAA